MSTSSNDYIHGKRRQHVKVSKEADHDHSGECAAHFGELLEKFPPQVSSRNIVAGWGCHIHNEVNKSLQKPLFDCTKIGDFYDCGCGEDGNTADDAEDAASTESTIGQKSKDPAQDEDEFDASLVKLEREESVTRVPRPLKSQC